MLSGLKNNGFVENLEAEFIGKGGQIRTGLMSARILTINNKETILYITRDITEKRQAENALKESGIQYQSMMEAMDDEVYICSSDFIIEYMNPAMIKRTGRDGTGEFCYNFINGLNEKCPQCVHEKIMNGENVIYEKVSPKDNKTYHISNSPIVHTDGTISKLTIFHDTTEFKKIELQLHQAQKMEAIGILAGGIAHDFNNILFPITGYAEMLLQEVPEDSPLRNRLSGIYTNALRAADLVKQILTFSRQDAGKLKPMKEIIDKIFDPFFTTKEKGKGTGMGLSVVHGIVKSMKGAIRVYSEPNRGTEFHVYLPVIKSGNEKQDVRAKVPILGGTGLILLVDDDEVILTMEKQMLARLGYQVTSRTSSIEALELFKNTHDKFDLIITDMAMPNMSGDKLSRELIKIRPDIPILLCTGFSDTMSKERAASLGIKGFLLKPILMRDLSQKIREVINGTSKK